MVFSWNFLCFLFLLNEILKIHGLLKLDNEVYLTFI